MVGCNIKALSHSATKIIINSAHIRIFSIILLFSIKIEISAMLECPVGFQRVNTKI